MRADFTAGEVGTLQNNLKKSAADLTGRHSVELRIKGGQGQNPQEAANSQ